MRAKDAFDESRPLPQAVLEALAYLDLKDDTIRNLEQENAGLLNRLLEHGERINCLTDEISRLRAHMPVDVLREYDRRQRER